MPDDWPAALDVGEAGAPMAGEVRSGDVAVFAATAAGGLACLIDGLGHGPEAADAAETCADVVRANADAPPQDLLDRCHTALLDSRGAVMTAAWFDLRRGTVAWAGVGRTRARTSRSCSGA